MLRAPICRQSATLATSETSFGASTSVTIARPVSARASASSSRPSMPRPRNVYGDERGLKAPPRSAVAPAARTARALRRAALHHNEHGGRSRAAAGSAIRPVHLGRTTRICPGGPQTARAEHERVLDLRLRLRRVPRDKDADAPPERTGDRDLAAA